MTEIVTIGLQVYRWQAPLDVALGLMRYLNFEVSQSIATDTGAVRLWLKLPPGMDVYHARLKIEEVAYPSGVSLIMESEVGEPTVPTPTPVPIPTPTPIPVPPPWWKSLKLGDKIKLARAGVKIYYDPNMSNVWNILSDGRTMDVFGVTGDYIQVKVYPPFNLFVNGNDVEKV